MTVERSTVTAAPVARPGVLQALRIVAPVITVLVFIQAIFAGQGLFVDSDYIDIHGFIGNITFLFVLAQAVLVFFAGLRGRDRTALIGMSLVLLVLVIAQLGMGYAGRDGGTPAALHVPNGVAIMALSVGTASYVFRIRGNDSTAR
jgi:uncharacterized membrane protein (UPF0182 family)